MAGGPHVAGEKKANAIAAMKKTLGDYHAGQSARKDARGSGGTWTTKGADGKSYKSTPTGRAALGGLGYALAKVAKAAAARDKLGKQLTKKGAKVAGAAVPVTSARGGQSPAGYQKRGSFMPGTKLQAGASGMSRDQRLMANMKLQAKQAMKIGRRTRKAA